MDIPDLGVALKTARKNKGLTQAQLASIHGMSRATISGLENGTINEIGLRKTIALFNSVGLVLTATLPPRRPTLQELVREDEDNARRIRRKE